jgi:hypothetical protein
MEKVTLSRKELYDLIWTEPMLSISKTYNISDVGLRKICIRMSIPVPQAGHWQKLKFGKAERKAPLPKKYNGENQIELAYRTEKDKGASGISKLNAIKKELSNRFPDGITVPDKLISPDKLIVAARECLNNSKHIRNGLVSTSREGLDIKVTKQNIPRALRFMDTLIKLLRQRGHDVVVRGDTYALVRNQEIQISLRGKTKKVMCEDRWRSIELVPTGALCFRIDGYSGTEWQDAKELIEDRLIVIIAKLEAIAEERNQFQEYWRQQQLKRQEQERLRQELEQKKKNELVRFTEMLLNATRWHKAENLRNYINQFERNAKVENKFTPQLEEWLVWARKKADWYDPFVESEDELLKDVDRETLTMNTNGKDIRNVRW